MAEGILVAGKKGRRIDIVVTQGDSWDYNFTLVKKDGTPWNLTGATFEGNIRKDAASPVLGSAATTVFDPALGKGLVSFTSVTTAAIPADPLDEDQEGSIYQWSYRVIFPSGRVRTLFDGEFHIRRKL